jgi:hypothetical protein
MATQSSAAHCRVGAALTARTYGELAALVSDLPAVPDLPTGAPAAKPKDLVRIDCRSGSARRDGRWMVPRRMQVQVTSGSVTLVSPRRSPGGRRCSWRWRSAAGACGW